MHGLLQDRIAIISGAARGIGLASAQALFHAGARVCLADIDADDAVHKALELDSMSERAFGNAVDIADQDSVQTLMNTVASRWGGIDILVNNAALGDTTALADITLSQWDQILRVNLSGALFCVQSALPWLHQSRAASVINIASTQGLLGQADAATYATAKGGLVNLTRCMAIDLGADNIRVNAVAPGFIDTRMALMADGRHEHQTDWFREIYIKHGKIPLRRPGQPEDVAGPVLFLASDLACYVTGQILAVDGGLLSTY